MAQCQKHCHCFAPPSAQAVGSDGFYDEDIMGEIEKSDDDDNDNDDNDENPYDYLCAPQSIAIPAELFHTTFDKYYAKYDKMDWLELHQEAQQIMLNEIYELQRIAISLGYVFPHVENDLKESITMFEKAKELSSNSIAKMQNEQLNNHKEFVGTALSACLKIGEK